MLVYANALQLVGREAFNATARAIHGWLNDQLGQRYPLAEILRSGQWKSEAGRKSAWLQVYAATGEDPEMYAWRLRHVDDGVSGRQWLVEIGVKQERDVVDFSCTVQTEEMSVLITQPVLATRPRLIRYLLDNLERSTDAKFAIGTPGVVLKSVGDSPDSYRGLLGDIERPERDYPIVLVSPDRDGMYLIGPSHLQEALLGLAQVVQVDARFNSWDMEEVLGRQLSAWGGAVNLIRTPGRDGFVRSTFFVSHEVEEWGATQGERVAAVLARVTHTTNVPRLRKRIRPDGVARLAIVRRMAQQRKELLGRTGSDQGMLELYKDELEEMTEQNQQLRSECDDKELTSRQLQEDKDRLDQELREERYKNRQLMYRSSEGTAPSGDYSLFLDLASRADQPSPKECLQAIQQAYPKRVTVLDSAYDSADEHARFDAGRRLLRLLKTLCTDYIEQIEAGGDNAARKCFTVDEYAATESESTQANTDMRRKRTFKHDGNQLEMYRHLKVGKADDERKSIRVYFEWLSNEKKVVIGHCGGHLPIISH
ncbi:hypothetical protein [Rhodanobacter spathiphylli]|uniref:Uncharacterized protein n=1 Tax=Rhodanobacter spathiphylli B39 TaxID=1163407 RepID=I4VU27_9GAMM|nr:hypothetical protein [Rhodanobacter spathiphylli]EIL90718.1 hypothetical protein UU7_14800 [Rhodanobacter spathiphylli B39]